MSLLHNVFSITMSEFTVLTLHCHTCTCAYILHYNYVNAGTHPLLLVQTRLTNQQRGSLTRGDLGGMNSMTSDSCYNKNNSGATRC